MVSCERREGIACGARGKDAAAREALKRKQTLFPRIFRPRESDRDPYFIRNTPEGHRLADA